MTENNQNQNQLNDAPEVSNNPNGINEDYNPNHVDNNNNLVGNNKESQNLHNNQNIQQNNYQNLQGIYQHDQNGFNQQNLQTQNLQTQNDVKQHNLFIKNDPYNHNQYQMVNNKRHSEVDPNDGSFPKLSYDEALIVLILNIFLPGIGTMLMSSYTSGGNWIVTGIIQLILAGCFIGWIWALVTGIQAITNAGKKNELGQTNQSFNQYSQSNQYNYN